MSQTASIHQDLIADRIKGSNKARCQSCQLYYKKMFSKGFHKKNTCGDTEDMLQKAFVQAFRNLGTFSNESGFEIRLKTITICKSINAFVC